MSIEPAPLHLPRNFVRPCVLLLLREHPAHGYDLLERLRSFGFSPTDPGRLYRALRSLEADGLVRSAWEPSVNGPNRRIYELTRPGMEELQDYAQTIASTSAVLDRFLTRYEEFVALGRRAASAEPLAR